MLITFIRALFPWGPLLFGVGFVAPLVAQTMDACAVRAPAPLTNLQFGLILGLTLGSVAKVRGRWV